MRLVIQAATAVVFWVSVLAIRYAFFVSPLCIEIAKPARSFQLGRPIDIYYHVSYNLPWAIYWQNSPSNINGLGSYQLIVKDETGRVVPSDWVPYWASPQEGKKQSLPVISEIGDSIHDASYSTDLRQEFTVTAPGTYTIQMIAEPVTVNRLGRLDNRRSPSNIVSFTLTP